MKRKSFYGIDCLVREGNSSERSFLIFHGYGANSSDLFPLADIFDPFYTSIYDDLVYDQVKNEYEIGEIVRITKPTTQSIILVLGSRTGRFVKDLAH